MSKRKRKEEEEGPLLPFDIPEPISPRKTYNVRDEPRPLWTKNKAKLIVRYLYYFVWVTKHGTYIDGFAGPQNKDREESWAAKLVLEDEPRWLRHFFLFDVKSKQAKLLEELRDTQPPPNPEYNEKKRDIQVKRGDFNVLVKDLLRSGQIGPKEATFCLLDQRTFECHWDTLKALAAYKTSGHKIELFYFLPNYWLNRAFSRQQDKQVIERWWGRSDWAKLPKMRTRERADLFTRRIEEELGYKSAYAWPIYRDPHGGRVMYHMIHATDHDKAPRLMATAYHSAVRTKESLKAFEEQLELEFGLSAAAPEQQPTGK